MKRSEMVKKLMETMGCYDSWEKQCSYMLEICEDEGMLPPPNPKEYDLVPTVTPTGNLDYSFKREWESE